MRFTLETVLKHGLQDMETFQLAKTGMDLDRDKDGTACEIVNQRDNIVPRRADGTPDKSKATYWEQVGGNVLLRKKCSSYWLETNQRYLVLFQ